MDRPAGYQPTRLAILKTLLPIQIVVQCRTRSTGFTHNLTPWNTEGESPQLTKANKYGRDGRLLAAEENDASSSLTTALSFVTSPPNRVG